MASRIFIGAIKKAKSLNLRAHDQVEDVLAKPWFRRPVIEREQNRNLVEGQAACRFHEGRIVVHSS
jgi:hypothetical protein